QRPLELVRNLVHETDAHGGVRVEALAREEVAAGPGADLRERERRDHRRGDPEADLGEAEDRVGRRHDGVGAGGEARAAAQRVAVDAGDHRCRAAVDGREHRVQAEGVLDVLVDAEIDRGALPVDVRARAEAGALSGQNDGARVADVRERVVQPRDQRGVEGVTPLGPRERDAQDGAVALDFQHVSSLSFASPRAPCEAPLRDRGRGDCDRARVGLALRPPHVAPPNAGLPHVRGDDANGAQARAARGARAAGRRLRLVRAVRRARRPRLLPGTAERPRHDGPADGGAVRGCVLPPARGGGERPEAGDGRHLVHGRPDVPAHALHHAAALGPAADLRLARARAAAVTGKILALAGVNVLMLVLGCGLLPVLRLAATRRELLARLPLAYAVGLAATGILAADLAVVDVPVGWIVLGIAAAVAVAVGLRRLRGGVSRSSL